METAGLTYLEQLQQLKGVTVRTGLLHEAQVLQLRNYPLLISGIAHGITNVDPETQLIMYDLTPANKKWRLTKKRLAELKMIVRYIRTIVWDNTVVVFNVNGVAQYDTRVDGGRDV
jgi:hypothetical protein